MDELIARILFETERLSLGDISDYREYEQLTELRQQLVDSITLSAVPLTEEQKDMIQRLRPFESVILSKMHRLKDEAELAMNRMNTSKKQFAAYNPSPMVDSILMDKRK